MILPMQRMVVGIVSTALSALLGVVASQPAIAQRGHGVNTMEWQVARSDVVVRATITKVVRDIPREQFEAYVAVTLKVHETLKGTKSESLTCLMESFKGDKRYEGWRDAKLEFIVFLVSNDAYSTHSPAFEARYPLRSFRIGGSLLRLGPPVPAEDGIRTFPTGVFDTKNGHINIAFN